MARRERTTALPRRRAPAGNRTAGPRRFLGVSWTEHAQRFAILGAVGLVLLALLGGLAYNVYESRIGTPNKVVLAVGNEKYKLSYYADRLGPFITQNAQSGSTIQLLEEDLIAKLEREALVVTLAKERGIALDNNSVLQFIAQGLGVPYGGTGSSFDTLYRNRLKEDKISDANFRRQKQAELADSKVTEAIRAEIPAKGEQLTLRSILVATKEEADKVFARVKGGEDFGTVAQKESLDLESRQKDGLLTPDSPELLPPALKTALEGKGIGEIVGPVQVQTSWWVIRVERREEADYNDTQKDQLATARLNAAIEKKRTELAGKIKRDLSGSDIDWAEGQQK